MKRKLALILLMLFALLVLNACSGQPEVEGLTMADPNTQVIDPRLVQQPTAQPAPQQTAQEIDWDSLDYDPSNEENGEDTDGYEIQSGGNYMASATVYPYTGATPMPLDPIDMPTPTPRPKLTFTYQPYDIARLGISFEGPVGWTLDESVESTMILWQPETEIMDNYRAFLSIEVINTGSSLSNSEMKEEVLSVLKSIGSVNYSEWSRTNTAARTLFGEDAVYADYRGVMVDGTIVRGRVHVASVNKRTVTVHMSCPGGFNEDYTSGMYVKMRNTLKMTN